MEKIKKIRKALRREKIDGYLIPKNDKFFGEYISRSDDRLNYISNFSGSYGFALILKNKNYLFIDGRYTSQAKNESGKFFEIVTFPKRMPKEVFKNRKLIIGFDPKLFTEKTLNFFFDKKYFKLRLLKRNLIDEIWKRKIVKSNSKFYNLPHNSVGSNFKSKINKIIHNLNKCGADYQFITSSENNAWLLNIRGRDVMYAPLPLSYILINKKKEIKFFCDIKKISFSLRKQFNKVEFIELESVQSILSKINKKKFIIDANSCSIFFKNIILKNNQILNFDDPIYHLKAIKSKNEIDNIKKAHIEDGVALTKFIFWVKKNFSKKKINEISASEKLYRFRKENKSFKFPSFPTISGSGPNGAIIHYKATKKTNRTLKNGDIYLVDSGGQYEFGTTDVTRTISLKNSNKRIKGIFTRVLKGHIAVANYNINKNTIGAHVDKVARKYLKDIGLDYSHGTGHGVGYFLNVHEGPHAISKNNKLKIKEGMVLSNEPGYYEKNKFGIRIENLIYVKKENNKNVFDDLTLAPIDKSLLEASLLNKKEKKWLNSYHKKVYEKLKNKMSPIELSELKKSCSAI